MAKPKASDIVGKIVDLLTELSPDERRRVIAASKTLLGDAVAEDETGAGERSDRGMGVRGDEDGETYRTTGKAKTWQKQNGVTTDQLAQMFHGADGATDIIGDVPGKNKKDQTLNAYVLVGIRQLLATGDPKFTDKDARAVCESAGCYDGPNHAKILKDKGNWFTGSKGTGWVLTAPGLKHGATLVKGTVEQK